ncbi:MAG: baseplate J/gp47 family protein [Clostridia bacterium]|nr:baseplate J/gp47 family protein [Clostridia bacterium]
MEGLEEYYDFDNILRRMLDKVPNNIDKREGSIIYDALAPCASELAQMYIVLKDNIDLVFVDTAVDEYLDRLCSQIGIERKQATKAIRKASFYDEENALIDIQTGERFTLDDLSYVVTEKISTGVYMCECETAGTEGNKQSGNLIPISYIQGLGKAILEDVLIPRRK